MSVVLEYLSKYKISSVSCFWEVLSNTGQVKPAETHLWLSANLVYVIGFGLVVLMPFFIVEVVTVCAYVIDESGFSVRLKEFTFLSPWLSLRSWENPK